MKNAKLLLIVALAAFVAALSLTTSGCKSESTEPEVEPITDDLFPLIVSRKLTFSGYLRDKTTDANIDATGAVYEARMTVSATSAPTPFGTAHVLSDSQRVPTGIATPPTIWVVQNFYIQRNPATGSGDFSFLTNIGRIYRLFGIQRTDTLRWVLLVNQSAGVGVEWTAFDSTWTGQVQPGVTGQVRLEVVGKIEGQENLTLGGQTFTGAYKIVAKRKVYLNGVLATEANTAQLWLMPNIGIVKFIFHADGESNGFYREYKSRNF